MSWLLSPSSAAKMTPKLRRNACKRLSLTTGAQARAIAGLVIDGGVRDVDALERRGFPVFAATIALRGAAKVGPGDVGGPVTVGDVEVAPGDWVVGDADGVTVIRAAELAA